MNILEPVVNIHWSKPDARVWRGKLVWCFECDGKGNGPILRLRRLYLKHVMLFDENEGDSNTVPQHPGAVPDWPEKTAFLDQYSRIRPNPCCSTETWYFDNA